MNATGYLIDPETRTVTEVEVSGDFKRIQEIIECQCFTVANMFTDEQDGIFVDDAGLFKEGNKIWVSDHYPEPLCGRGLVMGTNSEGDSVSPAMDLETFRESIHWTEHVTGW